MARETLGVGPIDLDLLASQTLGDRELEESLFDLFEAQADRLWPIIAGEGGNRERSDAAHTLKGGAAAIGAVEVMRVAGELERVLGMVGAEPGALVDELGAALAGARAVIAAWRAAA